MEKFSKKLQGVYKKGTDRIVVDLSRTTFVNSHASASLYITTPSCRRKVSSS